MRGGAVEFRVIDGGLVAHEMVVGGPEIQAAWEAAEASATPPAPGQSPEISLTPELAGLRLVLASGETRTGMLHAMPLEAPLSLGCHIPGHTAEGMVAQVRFVVPAAP